MEIRLWIRPSAEPGILTVRGLDPGPPESTYGSMPRSTGKDLSNEKTQALLRINTCPAQHLRQDTWRFLRSRHRDGFWVCDNCGQQPSKPILHSS